jgi:oxygen-independent coproporphyrinogen-3 oxidase
MLQSWLDPRPIEHLYVHVPFCAHKCDYCAFYSEPSKGDVIQRYVQALLTELSLVSHDLNPKTIFFGGGTPSLLTLAQWTQILDLIRSFKWTDLQEWTVECNPATVSLDKARLMRAGGVNRISMGVQSLDKTLLERLGRVHSREMVFKSYQTLRDAGFKSVNLDFMFGIPGQTMDIWKQTLSEARELQPEHLSCYEVIYEQDTPLFEQLKAGEFEVNEELNCAMFEELVDSSEAAGYQQYEISNFARSEGTVDGIPSYACRHNIAYWRGSSWYGLGPSAAEYVRGVRRKNWSNTVLYCEQLEKGKRSWESEDKLTSLARAGELAAFGLRMNAGWPLEEFKRVTGVEMTSEWKTEIHQLLSLKYADLSSDRFRLTRQGLRYADWAAELFLKTE